MASFSQLDRHGVAEGPRIACDVFHKQVGESRGIRTHPGVHRALAGQLPDQEHHAAQIGPQPAPPGPVVELGDAGVDFVEEDIGVDKIRGQCVKKVTGGDHGAQGFFRDLLQGIVQDPEL